MKIVSLSSMAFACLCFFSSCTKDSTELSGSNLESFSTANSKVAPGGTIGNDDVVPAMTISYNPDPGVVNQPVTLSAGFADGAVSPDCGKFQLQQYIAGQWVGLEAKLTISTASKTLTYTFTPDITGIAAYQFRLHYVVGNCEGYKTGFSAAFPLTVIAACEGLSIKGSAIGSPVVEQPGMYQFTVTYVVNPCGLEFDKLKTQGGLTNATSVVDATAGYETWVPGGSTNNVFKWEESTVGTILSTTTRTYQVMFTKAYSGTGPAQITGAWSVSASLNGAEVQRAEFPAIIFE